MKSLRALVFKMIRNKFNQHVFSVEELALKFKVHKNTIYNAIKCGRIQAFRIGTGKKGSFRILESEIERMIAFDATKMIDYIVEKRNQSSKSNIDLSKSKSE
jgi:excisionase family DNA binding protein